ncbi:MAG TPA: aldo/keto reductase [Clostridiaceae bacterium]|nr:aldo/keto reductase [Clostridiaceae bacterium]
MLYKNTKRIKEDISVLGIGCWNFGGDWETSDERSADRIIRTAVDLGINLFDVAPVYGWFQAEKILGQTLKDANLRDKVIVASKCGLTWGDDHVTANDLSKENLFKEIDGSLLRLQTDYIDIWQLHWPDHNTPIEETCEALSEIKKSGKIKYIGLSNFAQKDMVKFDQLVGVDVQQSLYNMFERNATSYHNIPLEYKTEQEVLPNVKKYGQAFLPYSPLFQGLLTGRFSKNKNLSKSDIRNENPKLSGDKLEIYLDGYEKLEEFSKEIGHPTNEIVINWLRQIPEVTSIIGGVSSVKQLKKNIDALRWDLNENEIERINEIIEPFRLMP